VYRPADLGTSLVFVGIFFGIAYLRRRPAVAARVARGGRRRGLPAVWGFLQAYQRSGSRFLDPYAVRRARAGTSSSRLSHRLGASDGKGLTAARSPPLGYLPIAESDSSSRGWPRTSASSAPFICSRCMRFLLVATLRIAFRARDPSVRLAVGVFAMLSFQLVVNVAWR